jgi:hypothetical protein
MIDIEYKVHQARLITIYMQLKFNQMENKILVLLNFEYVMEIVYDILIELRFHREIFEKIIKFHP